MPTSSISGFNVLNLGPLTTTWTPPATCTSGVIAPGLAHTDLPNAGIYQECDSGAGLYLYGDCIPGASSLEEYLSSQTDSPFPYSLLPYHSPAHDCPLGWTTAGVAEKAGNGTISADGVFSVTEWPVVDMSYTTVLPTPTELPEINYIPSALYPGETAVICCPSGWTAHPNDKCFSNYPIETFTASSACAAQLRMDDWTYAPATFTYNERVVTGSKLEVTGTVPFTFTQTDTVELVASTDPVESSVALSQLALDEYTGHTMILPVILIRTEAPSGDASGTGSADGGETTGADDPPEASGTRPSPIVALSSVLAAWAVVGAFELGLVVV